MVRGVSKMSKDIFRKRALTNQLALAAAALAFAAVASGETFPSRPVRIVVPAAPGGTLDIATRVLSQNLAEGLGQPVIIENRANAATTVSEEYVARATPDGYILIMTGTTRATNPYMHEGLTYDPVNDLASLSLVATAANVLVVNPSLPATTVRELIALAKSAPTPLYYGTPAFGSSGHLCAELFNQMAGTKLVQVPYKGAAPALADLLAGQIHMTFDNIP